MADSAHTGSVHPVLFVNPRSGGGKAQRYDLVARCRARGIEPIVMKEGDDLASLAAAAVSSGADVIGMAGGDGSQAIVAAVASRHDIPYVCIPAGTRNHFALDIGVDREDVIGALDAFHHGSERRIDLAQVNGRVFVNNVSIGFYGKVVQSPEYRDAKLRTVIEMMPDLLGPGATPFDLRFSDPGGAEYESGSARLGVQQPLPARPARGSGNPGDDGRRDARRGGGARRTAVAPPAGMDHRSLRESIPGPRSMSDWTARQSNSSHHSDSNPSRRPCASVLQPSGAIPDRRRSGGKVLRRDSQRASCLRGPRLACRPRAARSASFIEEGGVLGRLPFSVASAREASSTARLSVLRKGVTRRFTRDVLRPAGNGRWWSDRSSWATGR